MTETATSTAYPVASLVFTASSTVFCWGKADDVVVVVVAVVEDVVVVVTGVPNCTTLPSVMPSLPGSKASILGMAKPLSSIVVAMHLSKSLLDVVVATLMVFLEYKVESAPSPPASQQLSTAMHISERLATKSANMATCPHATSIWEQSQLSRMATSSLSKLTQERRVQAPSFGFAPDGQQSLKSEPEARQRMEDCNARSMLAALKLEAAPDAATKVAREMKAMGRRWLRIMVDGIIMMETEGAIALQSEDCNLIAIRRH